MSAYHNRKWLGAKRGFGPQNRNIFGRFKTFTTFRKLFKKSMGHTPRSYKGRFN